MCTRAQGHWSDVALVAHLPAWFECAGYRVKILCIVTCGRYYCYCTTAQNLNVNAPWGRGHLSWAVVSKWTFHWFPSRIRLEQVMFNYVQNSRNIIGVSSTDSIRILIISSSLITFYNQMTWGEWGMKNLPSVMWLISSLVCRWKLSCQIIFLQRKCPLMVFSPLWVRFGSRVDL